MELTSYKSMWIIAFFDLPTETKSDRKIYRRFRSGLLNDGFSMLQYSVYSRHCASEENTKVHVNRIKSMLPPKGEVRILSITDKQFERMQVFLGIKKVKTEPPPAQLEMF